MSCFAATIRTSKEFSAAMIRDRWGHKGGGGGYIEERMLPDKQQGKSPESSTDKNRSDILDELTGSSSGSGNQIPYPFRKKRRRKSWNRCAISACFISSRLNTIILRGLPCARTISVNFCPNEPVPPVTRTDWPSKQLAAIVMVSIDPQ